MANAVSRMVSVPSTRTMSRMEIILAFPVYKFTNKNPPAVPRRRGIRGATWVYQRGSVGLESDNGLTRLTLCVGLFRLATREGI